jgi:hypothetical protein
MIRLEAEQQFKSGNASADIDTELQILTISCKTNG